MINIDMIISYYSFFIHFVIIPSVFNNSGHSSWLVCCWAVMINYYNGITIITEHTHCFLVIDFEIVEIKRRLKFISYYDWQIVLHFFNLFLSCHFNQGCLQCQYLGIKITKKENVIIMKKIPLLIQWVTSTP